MKCLSDKMQDFTDEMQAGQNYGRPYNHSKLHKLGLFKTETLEAWFAFF